MKLKINYLENQVDLYDNNIMCIEIENKRYFYRVINDLIITDKLGNNDNVMFINDLVEINMKDKIKVIIDYFNFPYDSKKLSMDITKYLSATISYEERELLLKQYKKLFSMYDKIINNIDLPLYVDENIDINNVMKNVKIGIYYKEDLLDNLLLLIDVEKVLKSDNLIVFVNLKQYLNSDELLELYKYTIYNNVKILLIDSQCYGVNLKYEKKLIIDKELDEFMI